MTITTSMKKASRCVCMTHNILFFFRFFFFILKMRWAFQRWGAWREGGDKQGLETHLSWAWGTFFVFFFFSPSPYLCTMMLPPRCHSHHFSLMAAADHSCRAQIFLDEDEGLNDEVSSFGPRWVFFIFLLPNHNHHYESPPSSSLHPLPTHYHDHSSDGKWARDVLRTCLEPLVWYLFISYTTIMRHVAEASRVCFFIGSFVLLVDFIIPLMLLFSPLHPTFVNLIYL